MAKRVMNFKHNRTLDRLILAAVSLKAGKMTTAEQALEEIIEDAEGETEEELEVLNKLQQAAWEESQEGDDEEDEDEEVESEMIGDDEEDDEDDEDVLSSVKSRFHTRRSAKISHAKKVVANLAALRQKSRRR